MSTGTGLPASTSPNYRYLRVEVQGFAPSTLVLGYIDQSPAGPVEVWYSANREVLKLQNGRIVATGGLTLDWSATRLEPPPPAWPLVGPEGAAFRRVHDESAGYRTGLVDAVRLMPLQGDLPQALTKSLPTTLPVAAARSYAWFAESYTRVPSTVGGVDRAALAVPQAQAWFAWGRHLGQDTVVYSYQCLSTDFCLKLQRWPLQAELN